VLIAVAFRLFLRQRLIEDARIQSERGLAGSMEGHAAMDMTIGEEGSLWHRLRSKEAMTSVSHIFIMEWAAVIRDIVLGLLIAGAVAAWVPDSFWNRFFAVGHPLLSKVWGPLIGPIVSLMSFVCSIGNVPLAAALWKGGISFGGVVSFIFADLITFPLLLIYRRYYGTRLMLRMLALLWAAMSIAGLVTEGIFHAAGLIPPTRPTQISPEGFSWNYTTFLNLVFLVVFGVLYWTYRNRERLGGGQATALDPVCGMQVTIANAPASLVHDGDRFSFCSDRCKARFEESPARFATAPTGR